jgi:transcriptional regulator with XRE-family HTH domain
MVLTRSMMEGMTLQELLKTHGIHRPSELAEAAGIDRRYAWMLWHGKRRFSSRLALLLYDRKGIPVHELLRATPATDTPPEERPPRGRPPKRHRQENGADVSSRDQRTQPEETQPPC